MAFLVLKFSSVRTAFMIAFAVAILFIVAAVLLIRPISGRSLTSNRMKGTMHGILAFAHKHDRLPTLLAELPAVDAKNLNTKDAWGRYLGYKFDEAGLVT